MKTHFEDGSRRRAHAYRHHGRAALLMVRLQHGTQEMRQSLFCQALSGTVGLALATT